MSKITENTYTLKGESGTEYKFHIYTNSILKCAK